MSGSQPIRVGDVPAPLTQPSGPYNSPTYPRKVHAHERKHWQGVVAACEERLAEARKKLEALADDPRRARFERLHAQMLGARDQVAEAARRLPGEVGTLYAEDRERLEQAVAAMNRVVGQWEDF